MALRSQGYHANHSYLVHVRVNGSVAVTLPGPNGELDRVDELGSVETFDDLGLSQYYRFETSIDDRWLQIRVNTVSKKLDLRELPHVFTRGRVVFQSAFCRAVLHYLKVEHTGGASTNASDS